MSSRPLRPTSAPAVTLGEIARGLGLAHEGDDVSVTGVALHTQAVMPGDVFVALQGANRHGSEMVDEALAQGAVAVFTDVAGCSALGATAMNSYAQARATCQGTACSPAGVYIHHTA